MFQCERCRSSYSPRHAAVMENCPRCLARDRVASPLTFKAFELPGKKPPPGMGAMQGRATEQAPAGARPLL